MITPNYSITATERVLPKLALDFTTASLDARVTFTRTTDATHPATYVNSSGYITSANNDQARFDYDPVALTCKGLLIEESRTNSILNSANFSAASWATTNSSISANATTSPDGTNNAQKLVENSSNIQHYVQQSVTVTNTAYTYSVYAKPAGRNFIVLEFNSNGGGYCWFNVSTGAVGTTGGGVGTCTITNAENGWYRCSITQTLNAGAVKLNIYSAAANGSTTYQGDGTSGVYLYGAQLEAGAFPTSYIPTTTTALTRNADVATMTGTNFSDWFNASEGTFVLYAQNPLTTVTAEFVNISNGAYSNCISLGYLNTGRLIGQMYAGGSNILYNSPIEANMTSLKKQAITYKNGNNVYATGGTIRQTSTSASVPSGVNKLNIGLTPTNGSSANGWVAKIFYYNINFTSAQMQAFTK